MAIFSPRGSGDGATTTTALFPVPATLYTHTPEPGTYLKLLNQGQIETRKWSAIHAYSLDYCG